jgi:hypothetical protein
LYRATYIEQGNIGKVQDCEIMEARMREEFERTGKVIDPTYVVDNDLDPYRDLDSTKNTSDKGSTNDKGNNTPVLQIDPHEDELVRTLVDLDDKINNLDQDADSKTRFELEERREYVLRELGEIGNKKQEADKLAKFEDQKNQEIGSKNSEIESNDGSENSNNKKDKGKGIDRGRDSD